MENKNLIATAGLKKIRTAQILHVIAVVLATVGGIALLTGPVIAGGSAVENEALALGALGVAGIGGMMSFAGLIIAIVSFVMEIIGVCKAGHAHPSYKTALYMILINIALGLASLLVMNIPIFSGILQALSPIAVFLAVYFVLSATIALLREKGDEATAAKGTIVRTMYLVCTAVSVIGELVITIPALSGVVAVATMISSVVQIVALFMYISFLGRSVHTLSK